MTVEAPAYRLVIKSKDKTIKYNKVTKAEEVGRDTTGGKKKKKGKQK